MKRAHRAIGLVAVVGARCVVGVVQAPQVAARGELQRTDQIEAQPYQVEQVVFGELFAKQVGVNQTERPKAALGGPQATDVGEHQA